MGDSAMLQQAGRKLRQERSVGDDNQQLCEVRAQLESVIQEKNELLQNQEQVNAQWEGRVRRLERQLQAHHKGEKPIEVCCFTRQCWVPRYIIRFVCCCRVTLKPL